MWHAAPRNAVNDFLGGKNRAMVLGLDFLRVDVTLPSPGLRSTSGKISTPTAFRLIAQGCEATLGIGDHKCKLNAIGVPS